VNEANITLTPEAQKMIVVVAFLVQQIKVLPIIKRFKEYMGILPVILGVAGCLISGLPDPIMTGIFVGMSAIGGYKLMGIGQNGKADPTLLPSA